jgi:hypothetical protein
MPVFPAGLTPTTADDIENHHRQLPIVDNRVQAIITKFIKVANEAVSAMEMREAFYKKEIERNVSGES